MPPLIHATISWLVGAFIGSTGSWAHVPSALAAAGAAMVGGWIAWIGTDATRSIRRRDRLGIVLAMAGIGASGVIHARASTDLAQHCRTAIAQAIREGDDGVLVAFDDRVSVRGAHAVSVRGVATHDDAASTHVDAEWLANCQVPIVAHVTSGAAAPGAWSVLRGTALVTERGLRIDGVISPLASGRTDWRRAARGRTGEIIDRDFGRNAPLVRALLIADQDGIAPSVRDTFADAGLVHMLSISGLHVAIIAGALLTLAGAMRMSRTVAFAAAITVIVLYVFALGAPPPAVRSAVMLIVVGLAERLQRPTHPWTALALGAVIPTVEPTVVLDLGWQLSVSGMAALVAARALLRRLRHDDRREWPRWTRTALAGFQRLEGWRLSVARELITGVVATLVTAPTIAWTFGRVSVIAPLSNIVAGPLVAFVQPALFMALLAAPWPGVSHAIADATAPPLALLDLVARVAASVPFASLHLAPTALGALCAGVASAAFVRATAARRWMPGLLVAAVALTVGLWSPLLSFGTGTLELHVIDVGQGDALALRTPHGRWIVVDAGRTWDDGDAGRRLVVPYLRRYGGEVAAFVLSHAHDDHVGGAASVVQALSPQRWWEPAFVTSSGAYRRALDAVRQSHVAWHRVHPGDRWQLDGVDMRVLAPDSAWTAAQENANETSVILRVAMGRIVFLLTGDAEADEERWVIDHTDPALLRADVLKLGHHGSKTSSSLPFLDAVRPWVGVVSVGAGNHYGHPSPETLQHFVERGIPLFRTDLEGPVVISTDGRHVEVRTGRDRWVVPGGPEPPRP